jgi:hypothetical protein
MTSVELTDPSFALNPKNRGTAMMTGRMDRWMRRLLALPVVGTLALGGCISVKAPDKPIVIELNINIKQEVVYRLAGDAAKTIENNKDIF